MHHKVFVFILVALALVSCQSPPKAIAPSVKQASFSFQREKAPKGLYLNDISQILELPDEEIDIGKAALVVTKMEYPDLDTDKYLKIIDGYADELRKRLQGITYPLLIVSKINYYLFEELKYTTAPPLDANNPFGRSNKNDTFINYVIDTKKGNCVTLSFLYLAITERLGLSCHGVAHPGHFFVQYYDGRTKVNIETTDKGKEHTKEEYDEQ